MERFRRLSAMAPVRAFMAPDSLETAVPPKRPRSFQRPTWSATLRAIYTSQTAATIAFALSGDPSLLLLPGRGTQDSEAMETAQSKLS